MTTLAEDVRRGLAAKPYRIPSVHFYDAVGSDLFEEITRQPEYYLTETERAILVQHADEIVARADAGPCLVELGAGSAYKTRVLIDALLRRHERVEYVPIDVSQGALDAARSRVDKEYAGQVTVRPLHGRNREALARLSATNHADPRLVLFLGSSIGNFDRASAVQWLTDVGNALRPEDRFLMGTDMVKDESVLVPAYFDAAGVTTRFNLNLLDRINRELDADFDVDAWEHHPRWNAELMRMESHLVSRRDQVVHVRALDLTVPFAKGDDIHTENSHKYTRDVLAGMLDRAGLDRVDAWFDDRGWFGVHLLRPRR